MSYSNYEQTVIINGYALSGIQSVDGSYGITERPIKVAGVGFVDALVDAPLQGNFSFSRKMVGTDPLLETNSLGKYLLNEQEISGAILYDNGTKGFGFTKGRVSRYSVSCTVGEIPDIQTDITVYGNLGSGVAMEPATKEHPPIRYPDQSSIKITVSDFTIDPISDFSYSRAINTTPVYALPKGDASSWNDGEAQYANLDPIQIDTQYPIETDINFTMIASEYEIREIKDRIQAAPKSNVKIEIRDSQDLPEMINSFTGYNMRLISESVGSTIDGEMSLSLTYKGYETYHNPVEEQFDATKYTLTVEGDGGTEIGGGQFYDDTTVLLRAIPDEGYRFVDWRITQGNGEIQNPLSPKTNFITSFVDTTIQANYTQLYIVYLNGTNGVEVGQGGYDAGEIVNISAVPDDGYEFDSWSTDPDIVISDQGEGIYSFVMPARDFTITANYTKINYNVIVSGVNGAPVASFSTASIGDVVSLSANPDEGYKLSSWLVDQGDITITSLIDGTYTFVMPAENVSITANYELIQYSVSIDGLYGTEILSKNSASMGDVITISVIPYVGYEFVNWTVNQGSVTISQNQDGTFEFVMPAQNVSITANYQLLAPAWTTTSQTISFAENSNENINYNFDLTPDGVIVQYLVSGIDVAYFSVSGDGTLRFKNTPDFEQKGSYQVSVIASNDSGSSEKQLTIDIVDLPDVAPSWASSLESIDYTENDTSAVSYTLDIDSGDRAVTYSLDGVDAEFFEISAAGELTFKDAPDFEQKKSYQVDIVATNLAGSASKSITVNIINVIDAAPSWEESNESVNYTENSTENVSYTNDLNPGDSAVSYSLSGVDFASFSIDSVGTLTFNTSPDLETKPTYSVGIVATNSSGSSTKTLTINIQNVVDVAPSWATSSESIDYTENDTSILNYTNDLDPGDGPVTYSLSGADLSSFSVDSIGQITFNSPPDFEAKSSYAISIVAQNAAGSDAKQLNINIINAIDVAPSWGSTSESIDYAENDIVAVPYTNDLDVGDGSITYSLSGVDASSFSVSSVGVITFNTPPDFETKTSYVVSLTAGNAAGSSIKTFTINIVDVVDNAPSWAANSISITYAENDTSAVSYQNVLDPGDGTLSYGLSGADASSFSIDSVSGELTFNSPPDFETKNLYDINVLAINQFGSDAKNVLINIANVQDVAPSWGDSSQIINYSENNTAAVIYDNDLNPGDSPVVYSLSGADNTHFNISPTGVLNFNNPPDYETKSVYNVNIVATNNTGFSFKALSINIIDVVDVAPQWATPSEDVSYVENSTSSVAYINDLDPGDGPVTYSLSGNDSSSFSISIAGVLSFNSPPDYEQKSSYIVTIHASNAAGQSLKNLNISILNVVDTAPSWDSNSESLTYIANGTYDVPYTKQLDLGDSTVSYGVSGTNASSFSINSTTGALSFSSSPSGSQSSFSVNVVATNSSGSDSKTLTITIQSASSYANLDQNIDVTVSNGYYVFDNQSSQTNAFAIDTGTYNFLSVPPSHPIAFHSKDTNIRYGGQYWGGKRVGLDGNEYDFFYGNVILDVADDFGQISYECYNHGYMGGKQNLLFSAAKIAYPNQTLTINIDYSRYTQNALSTSDKAVIRDVCDKIESVILNNNTYTLYIEDFTDASYSGGTLAYAGPQTVNTSNNWLNMMGGPDVMSAVDSADVVNLRTLTPDGLTSLYWVMLHELIHAVGVGPVWNFELIPGQVSNYYVNLDTTNGAQYIGSNGLREYNEEVSTSLSSLPVQTFFTADIPSSSYASRSVSQNFSVVLNSTDISNGYILHNDPWTPMSVQVNIPSTGYSSGSTFNYTLYLTWGGHFGELTPDSQPQGYRMLNGVPQPLYEEELMTPYFGIGDKAPMSRITLGFLHDLTYIVDYSKTQL